MFGKKKVSIDFTEPEYTLLTEQGKKEGKSNSFIINKLIGIFLRLSPDVAKKVGYFCHEQYLAEQSKLERLFGFERDDTQRKADQFSTLSSYFGYDEKSEENPGMKRTYLRDGYVIYPNDWIVLNDVFGPADSCSYAGVVESRNSSEYGIPHFIFFSNAKYGRDYTDDMTDKIYEACAEAYPDFKKYWNLQLPIPDLNDEKAVDAWKKAPEFSVFHIPVKGDPIGWPREDYKPPFGAMIIRDTYEKQVHKKEN